MKWIKPKDQLPPQGKKILYFKEGDIYVVQKYGDLWLPIPFYDSQFAFHDAPDLWADIIPPEGFTGKLHFAMGSPKMIDTDELQEIYPTQYNDYVEALRKMWVKNEMD